MAKVLSSFPRNPLFHAQPALDCDGFMEHTYNAYNSLKHFITTKINKY